MRSGELSWARLGPDALGKKHWASHHLNELFHLVKYILLEFLLVCIT
jgi:hypothetical protein